MTTPPGMRVATPSVLEIDRFAVCCSASESVAELFELFGSVVPAGAVTVAVLMRFPVAPAAMFAVRLYVAVPPLSRVTVSLMLPDPDAVQLEPAVAEQVHVAPDNAGGSVSLTVAPTAVDGPLLEATIV